jgi:hypothetical protein
MKLGCISLRVNRRHLIWLLLIPLCYWVAYFSLRVSGSISPHFAQGHFELEFQDRGVIEFFPNSVSPLVLSPFFPLMWIERPFLKFYAEEPNGG